VSELNDQYPEVFRIQKKGSRPTLTVRRSRVNAQGPVVVLLHGGNTGSATFNFFEGDLATTLAAPRNGFNVWLVDWRGSPEIVEPIVADPNVPDIERERAEFSLDTTANDELPEALAFIRGSIHGPIAPAHCPSRMSTIRSSSPPAPPERATRGILQSE
jgi:pimeloyl-ACP methyl ester carboxylesterase